MKVVFIQGANLAGLTCAARLQKFKYQTFLVGDTYQNTRIDGFEFDTAPFFTIPAVYRDFFQKTGKHFGQVLEVKAVEPAFIFRFPDLEITFANLSRSARLAEIKNKLGDAAATEWDALLKTGEYFWERMRENYLEWEFSWLRADFATLVKLRIPRVSNPYLQKIPKSQLEMVGLIFQVTRLFMMLLPKQRRPQYLATISIVLSSAALV